MTKAGGALGVVLALVSVSIGCGRTASSDAGTAGLDAGAGSGGRGGASGAGGVGTPGNAGAGPGSGGAAGTTAGTGGRGGSAGGAGTTGGTGGTVGGRGGASGTGGAGGSAGAGGRGGTGGSAGAGGRGGAAGTSDAGIDAGAGGAAGSRDASSDASDASDANDGSADGGPVCTNVCTLGSRQCGGGGTQTCVTGSNGCTEWGPAVPCPGIQTCAASSGLCVCPPSTAGCTADNATFCQSMTTVATCHADAQGCFTTTTASCPTHQSCKGAAPAATCSCDDQCPAVGNTCSDSKTVATCAADSNQPACIFITGTATCPGSSLCMSGACVCPGPVATPAAGGGCPTPGATACAGSDILTCTVEAASNCPIWIATTRCGNNPAGALTCGTKGGSPACQCPENAGLDVFVDPVLGSDVQGGLYPTGVGGPPQCRFATLGNGLAKVGAPGRVVAISENTPAMFTGESFPLAVPNGVGLITASATFDPTAYEIAFDDPAANAAVTLADNTAMAGFTIISNGGAPTAAMVTCDAGYVTMQSMVLDGGAYGARLLGSCGAMVDEVRIRNASSAALDVNTSGVSIFRRGELSGSLVGLSHQAGTLMSDLLNVHDNLTSGIMLFGGAPDLQLGNGSTVTRNGLTGAGYPGISVAAGSAVSSNSSVTGNGAAGILISSAAGTHAFSLVDFSSNGVVVPSSGIVLAAGAANASGVTATGNTQSGLAVSGGSILVNSTTLNGNKERGIDLTGGTVNVYGGSANGNGLDGIQAAAGTLTVQRGTELANNAGYGLRLGGAVTTVQSANIHDNTPGGVLAKYPMGATVNIGAAGQSTQIHDNRGGGLVVDAAPATASGANSLTVDNVSVVRNDAAGIHVMAGTGSVAATIRNNTVTTNRDTGILIEQGMNNTAAIAIQSNDVSGNNTMSVHTAGGILFATSATVASFIGNKIHSNGGDELGFAALPNGGGATWTIGTNTCDASANSIYCYGIGNVGLRVSLAGVDVDARASHWANASPAAGIDFSNVGGASVNAGNACSAIPACP